MTVGVAMAVAMFLLAHPLARLVLPGHVGETVT